MPSDDDDVDDPPKDLLEPITHFQPPPSFSPSTVMTSNVPGTVKKPYQITFPSREKEKEYTRHLLDNCSTFNGDPDQLITWLKETSAFILREGYPETDHPFIIRHLLIDDALDFYLAHEDLIFNFYDLRKLFLHKNHILSSLRTVSTLDSISSLSLTDLPPALTSTQLAPNTTAPAPGAQTTFSLTQSIDELTQNDIRKTIIEDLQRNTSKFTGDHRQDVLKWLKHINNKFETAGIPDVKKFDFISQLLAKGALDWFYDNKSTLNHSWSAFLEHFQRTFDSPNRARIALQKLHSYAQSPQQDIRSFCSEMRKLFLEADPDMSSTMKLELLLAKVHPSFRLDLLKQKPKDPNEFEVMAKDLENTYLVLAAIEQNVQASNSSTPTPTTSSFAPYSSSSSQRPQGPSYNPSQQYGSRPSNSSHYSSQPSSFIPVPRFSSPSLSTSVRRPFQPPSGRGSTNPRFYTSRQHLSVFQPSMSSSPTLHSSPPSETRIPLMSIPAPIVSPPFLPVTSSSSTPTVRCQLCFGEGHSAPACPF
jgi:hypothetical protein